MKNKKPLIVALDLLSASEALTLCNVLLPEIDFFKVGLQLFLAGGRKIIKEIKSLGGRVFLDLKLFDIPNQVKESCRQIAFWNVEMLTVHTLGGLEMMIAARKGLKEGASSLGLMPPLILGITILTSFDQENLKNLGISVSIKQQVLSLAKLAKKAALDGVVASGEEISLLRSYFPEDFCLVVPGLRESEEDKKDQKRVITPREAWLKGANYLVIGRPILTAKDPKKAALQILEKILPKKA